MAQLAREWRRIIQFKKVFHLFVSFAAASRENLFNMINYISFNFFIRCFFFFINFIIFFIFHSKHCFHILIISFAERSRKTGSFEWGVREAFGVKCS